MPESGAQSSKKQLIKITIGVLLVFAIGFGAGMTLGVKQFVRSEAGSVDISKVIDLYSKTRSPNVSFDQFWTVWNKIKEKHVSQPVNDVDLFYGAISGLVKGLHDPYSVYFPPAEAEEFSKDLAGEFEGIGAEIGLKQGQLTVIAPMPGSPAETAGLTPGDKIFAIDGKDTSDMTLDEAVMHIRGERGTTVVLTISHDGFETVEDVSIVRDTINVPTVTWEMKEGKIAYMRLSYFNETTWREFDDAVKEIVAKSPKGLVLDLRRNPGGFLDTAISVASEWVPSGIIVKERYSDNQIKTYQTHGDHRLAGMPTVILVDEGSASGSEIVAGALQDHGLAQLVGAQTYGKGSVQDFDIFPDGSALKLTIAKWLTPKDRQIDDEGITPDVVVEPMFSEIVAGKEGATRTDFGLEKALELLKSE